MNNGYQKAANQNASNTTLEATQSHIQEPTATRSNKSEHTKATQERTHKGNHNKAAKAICFHSPLLKQRAHEKNVPPDGHASRKKWPVGPEKMPPGRCCAAWWLATLNAAASSQHASTFSCAQSAWDPIRAKFFAMQLPSPSFGKSCV